MQTRIICTLGPASSSDDVLKGMADAGMTFARFNFSHGTHDEHARRVEQVRRVAAVGGYAIDLMQDLQGPKIRTVGAPRTTLQRGDELLFDQTGAHGGVMISEPTVLAMVEPGHRIYIDDGMIELQAVRRTPSGVVCQVLVGGVFEGNQGVAFPSSLVPLPALTEKDIEDLHAGRAMGFDWVALSFVQRAADLDALHAQLWPGPRVIAKIETATALADLPRIAAACDALMVARGDLGVSIPRARVPLVQKDIVHLCRAQGSFAIVATDMMRSMVDHAHPTRAEASDVATALFDGSHAVMLSEETAIGAYPVQVVAEMRAIIEAVEASPYYHWSPQSRATAAPGDG